MRALVATRVTLVWMLLVAATFLSLGLGHGLGFADLASVAIIVVATVKARFVIFEFMEIRHAPRILQIGADAWTVGIGVVLVVLLVTASA